MHSKGGYVYIMTNARKTTLYVGVTSQLYTRVWEHKNELGGYFTKRYKCKNLVYHEFHDSIESAIHREKRIKHFKRDLKEKLIGDMNPAWDDLWESTKGMD